ncbi:DUF2330 domain-containing protein [Pseudenhygromyxa sp. WMMC2535]|uniref:DUF2330 domain-containing protein n=1 Tax=Pseudenhygromyxa sp. WMMC2535 TaxID=2712867 RepID=UPI001551AFEB|nr:DUF2330 domain-containing protein [Pseudenhygromyxa sp. WMMC2535]NVB36867.1 DUF2330 domain-containing protein [Pseudenhygromyxa sp. WMMC2535]
MLRRLPTLRAALLAAALATPALAAPTLAHAFCGFYVAGAEGSLYNNATMVVLMRDGTRTVLSMANNYQGPPENFAMVVPVPVVLGEDDVKVLPAEIFDRVDKLAAPRLVEYWEQDPCEPQRVYEEMAMAVPSADMEVQGSGRLSRDLGVTIEAEFEVGEYQVVILSAKESTGLDTWLRQEQYNIPAGAEALLRPYVEGGMKFFVAKVDAQKVGFDDQGMATLSPLRFHYDSQEFALPVRLGLINAGGPQDLLVHVLARGQRYEVANYPNVAIPTNLEVKDAVRERFGSFYASLFDHVLAQEQGAVVTEYAWAAGSCDPCPEAPLNLEELVTLGADVLPSYERAFAKKKVPSELAWQVPNEFVLTRLHARYDSQSLGEDLIFQAAPAIVGGREVVYSGELEHGAMEEPDGYNNFQARYIIRHEWTGPIECEEPQRGIWGGPWPEVQAQGGSQAPAVAQDLAFVERGAALAELVSESAAARIEADVGALPEGPVAPTQPDPEGGVKHSGSGQGDGGGCAHCSAEGGAGGAAALGAVGLLGLLGLGRRRRRRRGA